jgi:WD40 repeat protein
VAAPIAAGRRLGDVTIVRLLAVGGMGRVYEGIQASPARTVAVKVLRDALLSPAVVRRFVHEADFLARLKAPGIAQIYAAGIEPTSTGDVPYFIMEMVADAMTITEFARARKLTVRDRVALVARVAAAVAHAHRQGVVHRDLKPGNMLVDADGDPKVIDFGVARAIGSSDERLTTVAEMGQVLGTVRYMAPEQLGLADCEADARTDVYALGLVLHELLFDELPYELGGRSVLEAAAILGRRTGGDAGLLARRLRGSGLATDELSALAAILATCIEPRPADRYQSGHELAADLARWLAGQPVHARPPNLSDSIVRLARRHRVAAVAVSIGFVTLVIALGVVWTSWQVAETQRRIAALAHEAADTARVAAEEQRAAAEAQATEVRRQLYFSTVQLAAEARDRDNVAEARRLLAEAHDLAPGVASVPIELDALAASLDESLATLDADAGTVTAVALSRDGRTVAAGTEAGRVLTWKPGEPPVELPRHEERIWAVAIAPDGERIAVGTADGLVFVHDRADGDATATLDAHDGTIYGLDFSPDGRLLATASRDRSVGLWETNRWQSRRFLTGHQATVLSATFANDGTRLLTTSSDGTFRVWQVADGHEVLRGGDGSVRLFRGAWSDDGSLVATAGEDGMARVWHAATGAPHAALPHPHRVNAVAFTGDGMHLVTASGDAVLRDWDIESRTVVARRRGHASGIWSLAAHSHRDAVHGDAPPRRVAIVTGSADGTLRTWELGPGGEPAVTLDGRGVAVAASARGDMLAVSSARGDVWLLDPATLRERRHFTGLGGRVNGLAFSPDGRLFAAADDGGTLHRWRLPDSEPLEPLRIHARRAFDVCFSPDGRVIATAGEDRTARILDGERGEDRVPPLKHPARVFSTTFHPGGMWLATACEDHEVRIWNASTGQQIAAWPGHTRAVNWVCFAPNGRLLASASSDGTVRLWDLNASTGSDGAAVAAAPPTPRVLTGPSRQVWKVAFSHDGSRLAATSADGLVQLWDVDTGRPVSVLRGHRDETWGLAFLAGGRVLATTSWDGTLRLWGMPMAVLAAARDAGE